MSLPVVTPANFDIGPCQVTFNGIDIGGTAGNVKVTFKYDKAPMMADQYGKTLLDEAISGMECTVETEFLESKNKLHLNKVFPSLRYAGTAPADILEMDNKIAIRQLAANASLLTLHPIVDDPSVNFDYTFFKAVPDENSSIAIGPAEQRKWKIIWKIYLDVSVSPARMFRYGDTTI